MFFIQEHTDDANNTPTQTRRHRVGAERELFFKFNFSRPRKRPFHSADTSVTTTYMQFQTLGLNFEMFSFNVLYNWGGGERHSIRSHAFGMYAKLR